MPANIRVEVAYALPEKQYLQRVTLDEGATVEQAIIASGLLALRHDIDLAKNKLGIYSRPVKLHDEVHDGELPRKSRQNWTRIWLRKSEISSSLQV